MNTTTIEQSNKLLSLGIDPNTADMTYEKVESEQSNEYTLKPGLDVSIKFNLYSFRSRLIIPAWSLEALIRLLPKHYYLGRGNGGYFYCYHVNDTEMDGYCDPIEAVYNTICKLLNNHVELWVA